MGCCPPPLPHQLDASLPGAIDTTRIANAQAGPSWLIGEASRVPEHLIPVVDVAAIVPVHCALWPWFHWRQWRQFSPQGQLYTGFSWYCDLCDCPVTRAHLSSELHLKRAADPPDGPNGECWHRAAHATSSAAGYRDSGDSPVADFMRDLLVRYPTLLKVSIHSDL